MPRILAPERRAQTGAQEFHKSLDVSTFLFPPFATIRQASAELRQTVESDLKWSAQRRLSSEQALAAARFKFGVSRQRGGYLPYFVL